MFLDHLPSILHGALLCVGSLWPTIVDVIHECTDLDGHFDWIEKKTLGF
jgi:hypothetical protein